MLAWLKRALLALSLGAALGFVAACLLGKQLTSMFFGSLGGSFSCRADVELALDQFVATQLYSAITFALVAFVVMLLVRRWWSKRSARPAPTAAGPSGAAG